jgi:lipopolysaccharide assembly outer membrane protein LptD (OstA)
MAIRLEWILSALIVMILGASYFVKISDQKSSALGSTKELEFHHTSLIEVDQHSILGQASAITGVMDSGILHLKYLQYHTDTIDLLRADSATLEDRILYLDGNLSLEQKEGFSYQADNAIYNKRTKILHVTSPFKAILKNSVIEGRNLIYDTLHKEATASTVDAVIYTTRKQ